MKVLVFNKLLFLSNNNNCDIFLYVRLSKLTLSADLDQTS